MWVRCDVSAASDAVLVQSIICAGSRKSPQYIRDSVPISLLGSGGAMPREEGGSHSTRRRPWCSHSRPHCHPWSLKVQRVWCLCSFCGLMQGPCRVRHSVSSDEVRLWRRSFADGGCLLHATLGEFAPLGRARRQMKRLEKGTQAVLMTSEAEHPLLLMHEVDASVWKVLSSFAYQTVRWSQF